MSKRSTTPDLNKEAVSANDLKDGCLSPPAKKSRKKGSAGPASKASQKAPAAMLTPSGMESHLQLTTEDVAILAEFDPEGNTPWTERTTALLVALYHQNPTNSCTQIMNELNARIGYKRKQVENKLYALKNPRK
ncbi:hypothetical protein HK104_010087 [Borealophlyctis nickersoniae]|nr:hypothetical protein HK104_010087 [Borealophlyctis nickersoniae]